MLHSCTGEQGRHKRARTPNRQPEATPLGILPPAKEVQEVEQSERGPDGPAAAKRFTSADTQPSTLEGSGGWHRGGSQQQPGSSGDAPCVQLGMPVEQRSAAAQGEVTFGACRLVQFGVRDTHSRFRQRRSLSPAHIHAHKATTGGTACVLAARRPAGPCDRVSSPSKTRHPLRPQPCPARPWLAVGPAPRSSRRPATSARATRSCWQPSWGSEQPQPRRAATVTMSTPRC